MSGKRYSEEFKIEAVKQIFVADVGEVTAENFELHLNL
jgi:transposase-like protein